MRILLLILLGASLAASDSSGPSRPRLRGFLISVMDEGVIRFDLKGERVWSHACRPYDARDLGGGRVLVVERQAGRVFEVNREGREVWEKAGLASPVDADRLANGNTLILENGADRVIEVAPGGEVVLEIPGLSNAYDADRLPGGNTLVADSGNNRIAEFDARGRLVRETAGLSFPNNVLRLPDGRTLFTTYTRGSVGALDAAGKLDGEHPVGGVLYSVTFEDGALWVSEGQGGRVLKLSRDGNVLEERKLGKTFVDLDFFR